MFTTTMNHPYKDGRDNIFQTIEGVNVRGVC